MLKRTYALGLLAAATLGCFLTPAAHASQVEIIANRLAKCPSCWYRYHQDLDQGSYQNQVELRSGYYHPKSEPQLQI